MSKRTFTMSNKLMVMVPKEGQPTMHAIWYRLTAIGNVKISTSTVHGESVYILKVECDDGTSVTVNHEDLYRAMLQAYHLIVSRLVHKKEKQK